MAIEALEMHVPHYIKDRGCEAIQACKEALEQPAQEPVEQSPLVNQLEGYKAGFEDACRLKSKQPAQEPVEMPSKLSVLNKYGTESEESIKAQQTYAKGWNDYADEVSQLGSLYTYPTPSWQGLSDGELSELLVSKGETSIKYLSFARAIEQALKEKNNGTT
jgi:hypothetical protein